MSLRNKAMMVQLTISAWTGKVQDKRITTEIHQQHQARDAGRFTKNLLEKKDLGEITGIIQEARLFHDTNSLPWLTPFRLMTVEGFDHYNNRMIALKARYDQAVIDFIKCYPETIERNRERLNGMFNADDYPASHELEDRFSFKVRYQPIPNEADFRIDLHQDHVEAMKRDLMAEQQELVDLAARKLWIWLKEAVQRAHEALDNPKGRLYQTTFGRFGELAQTITMLNLTEDRTLEDLATETRTLMEAIDLDRVKSEPTLRKETAQETNALLDKINAYL